VVCGGKTGAKGIFQEQRLGNMRVSGGSRLVQEFRGSGFKGSRLWLAAALRSSLPFDITSDLLLLSSNRWTFEP